MSRLVAFGCSYTYGHGLEDCFDPSNNFPGPSPSKFAWPSCLGNLLGRETINRSRPGASNLEILYNILNFDFQEDDIVCVLWTSESRDLIFLPYPTHTNGLGFQPIGTWMNEENDGVDVSAWLKIHSDYDLLVRTGLCIHHAEHYLENKKIKNYSFYTDPKKFPEFLKFKNNMDVKLYDIMFTLYDRALDGGHPGPLAQQKTAEEMYKYINE